MGGGSGGHVTPVAAVLNELVDSEPHAEIRMWTDRSFHDQTVRTMKQVKADVRVDTILAGKFRRYHKLSFFAQIIRLKTIVLPNIRDGLFIAVGFMQSFVKLILWRPDVVFCKGGYVCLPVGVAASMLKIPIVLHDSDVHPGLANRVLSRWASVIGTGMPTHYYQYPKQRMRYVGVPIAASYHPYTEQERSSFKAKLGFYSSRPLVVITGGGLGSQTLNDAVTSVAKELTEITDILLISGKKHYEAVKRDTSAVSSEHFIVRDYVYEDMATTLAAADIVVTRAGATTMLELAALAKPSILVPSPYLTGGHQIKNAAMYGDMHAATVMDEIRMTSHPNELLDTINAMLLNTEQLAAMSASVQQFAKPNAAREMADVVIEVYRDNSAS